MRYSLYVCLFAGIFYFISFHYYKNWQNGLSDGDPAGYYIWLPSVFIYDDVTHPVKTIAVRRKVFNQRERSLADVGFMRPEGATGEVYLNKYTMGMAIMYAPFFATAHFLAPLLGYEQDGFSLIYRYLVFLNAVIYAFLGLLILRKVLLLYFSEGITTWTLAIVGLGTNLYFFSSWNTGMGHAASFALFAMFLWLTEKWYSGQQIKHAAGAGAVFGLIALIRPTDAISIGIPLFWGIVSWSTLRSRIDLLLKQWQHVGAMALSAFAIGLPQLLFWKINTGTFFYYSYGDEKFDFTHPHLREGIFGYQNGWLTYTPVMYLAIIGILWLWRKRNNYLSPVLFILPLQLYIAYSWWCWQYINGFGARPMVQYYALLAIPLAGTLTYAFSNKWLRWPVTAVAAFCIVLNVFQTWQFNKGLLWPELGTRRFFFSSMWKTKLSPEDLLYFDGAPVQPADTSGLKLVKTLYFNDFEDSTSTHYSSLHRHSGRFAFRFDKSIEFSPGLVAEPVGPEIRPGRWLKLSVWCMRQHEEIDLYTMSMLVTYIGHKGEMLRYHGIRLDNKPGNVGNLWSGTPNVWAEVVYYVPVPDEIQVEDLLKVYVWNPHSNEIFIDDLRVELYE